MKTPRTLFALWSLTFTALAIDLSPNALKNTLLGFEGPGEGAAVVREIEELPADQRKTALMALVQIVRDETEKSPTRASRLIGAAAFVLKAIRDEPSLISAFADGLGQMNPSDQMDAADALSVCTSPAAADAIAVATRSRLDQVRQSLNANATEDERRALNDASGNFVQLMKRLAKTAEPHGKNLAAGIRAELVAKSSGAPFWNLLLQAVDADVELHTPLNGSASNSTGNKVDTQTLSKSTTSKTLEAKPSLSTPSEEPSSSTPWIVIVILIAAASGLAWLLLKRRS